MDLRTENCVLSGERVGMRADALLWHMQFRKGSEYNDVYMSDSVMSISCI
ncbi:MAG: hypothetical protein ACHQF2_02215 [Flavobacteriales bacterium]